MTPENFLAVLRGDAEAVKGKGSGKVLKRYPLLRGSVASHREFKQTLLFAPDIRVGSFVLARDRSHRAGAVACLFLCHICL